jgi:hypothetical protein
MSTAAITIGTDHAHREEARELTGRHQAMFWRSPFAVCAAILVSTQLSLIAIAGPQSEAFPYEATFALTAVSAMFLVAGVWPNWNFIELTQDGLEQQAGLRSLKVSWPDVQHVRVFDGWVELRVVTGDEPGKKKVSTRRVFNRYDIPSDAFGEAIENAWLNRRV